MKGKREGKAEKEQQGGEQSKDGEKRRGDEKQDKRKRRGSWIKNGWGKSAM